jgi:GMP synthase-like glutamine amidotransferase
MKAHILQHVPFEDIGSIHSWLATRQAEITYTRFFNNETPPGFKELDLVVIMGGPMSVNDESAFPWLRAEKEFIRTIIQEGIPTVGICLGAQLIASALGARVYQNDYKEIGWFPIMATPHDGNRFRFPKRSMAFHWHGETFDLPQGAIHLARSKGCENQAFQINEHVIGLQFHLETTPQSLQTLVSNCRQEIIPGTYVQTEKELLQATTATYAKINAIMNHLLSHVTGLAS